MEKTSIRPAWLLPTVLLASCTAIVGSKLEKPRDAAVEAEAELETELDAAPDEETAADEEDLAEEDAVEDTPVDVGPDFDRDTCGAWGTVAIPDHEAVGIDTGDEDRDGRGSMQIMVLYPDSFIVDYLNLKVFPEYAFLDFTLDGPNYYCIPEAFFTDDDIVDAWIIPFVLDGRLSEPEEPHDFLTFQGIIPDPVTVMIAASTYRSSEATRRSLSPLYWTDAAPDNSLDVGLARRASKFNGTIQFSGFVWSGGLRNARACITVFGERDPGGMHYGEYPAEILGYNYIDLEDTVVESNSSQDFFADFAAGPQQTFMVYVRYFEGREEGSVFEQCGRSDAAASCAQQCYRLDDTVGVPFEGGIPFEIDPAIAADPACTISLDALCE